MIRIIFKIPIYLDLISKILTGQTFTIQITIQTIQTILITIQTILTIIQTILTSRKLITVIQTL